MKHVLRNSKNIKNCSFLTKKKINIKTQVGMDYNKTHILYMYKDQGKILQNYMEKK